MCVRSADAILCLINPPCNSLQLRGSIFSILEVLCAVRSLQMRQAGWWRIWAASRACSS